MTSDGDCDHHHVLPSPLGADGQINVAFFEPLDFNNSIATVFLQTIDFYSWFVASAVSAFLCKSHRGIDM